MSLNRRGAILGCILGTAVGDATGILYENLSPKRLRRLYGQPSPQQFDGPKFWFNKGMISDDTEHTCLTAQALIESGADPELFEKMFIKRLKWWLLGLPAGLGKATFLGIFRLWLGYSSQTSGVFSAGNGPAMRCGILGVCFGDDPEQLKQYVAISTRVTHSDPKAEVAALAIAIGCSLASQSQSRNVDPDDFLSEVKHTLDESDASEELIELLVRAVQSVKRKQPAKDFAGELGLSQGVTGYSFHTVPIAIHLWLTYPADLKTAVQKAIALGGDTDTVAAIAGALIGSGLGEEGVPQDWLDRIWEWPCDVKWMRELGTKLNETLNTKQPGKPLHFSATLLFIRNLFFFAVVILHTFHRWFPPYHVDDGIRINREYN